MMTESTNRPDGADYRTFSLTEATFLTYRGHSPRVQALTDRQAEFVFGACPELTESLGRYATGPHQLDAMTYQALRDTLRKKAVLACRAMRREEV